MKEPRPALTPKEIRAQWGLDPTVTFLNHGAFGACPRPVLEAQDAWRVRLEQDPVRFLYLDLEALLDDARHRVAEFVDADPEGLVFVSNATEGVNSVLASFPLGVGDQVLVTNHGYPACRNAAQYWAARVGAQVVEVELPFPTEQSEELVTAILSRVSASTRLALIDQVTSPTALVLPVQRIVSELKARGVATLIDGAHAPGMLPLSMRELASDFYVGNFHKWCCAPKGAAMLYASAERRAGLHPVVISHGSRAERADRSRLWLEFDWVGVKDPTPWLCVPAALGFLETLSVGGWPGVFSRNHLLALEARELLARALGVELPCPSDWIGSMAAVPLPRMAPGQAKHTADSLYRALLDRHRIQVPIASLPGGHHHFVRVSAHLYNEREDYERLARALLEELQA